jgi:fermentation-respiration switch protein FrsA (DUF1100 family)
VAIAVVGYLCAGAVMYVAQRSLLFPGATNSGAAEAAAVPWAQRVTIATPDGEALAALHVPAAKGRPTFLFFPGNGDNIVGYGFLAELFAARGDGLLAVSYRGYPGSTGSPSETGLLIDGLAAFDWLSAHANSSPIIILGRSLGTGVAVNTAAERDAAAVVLVSAYESIVAVARGRYPYLPVGLLISDGFHSDRRIGRVAEPKLFVHGDLDQSIPMSSGQALFAAAPEPKTFSVQHGLGHNDIWKPAVVAEIMDFADAATRPPPAD